MAKPNHSQLAKPAAPLRSPAARPRVGANRSLPSPHSSSPSNPQSSLQVQPTLPLPEGRYEAQLRWFEREVTTLRQLAQTERLAGDYVAAQRLERELDSFIKEFIQETAALLVHEEPL